MGGTLNIQVEYANDLQSHGLLRQSPYCQLTVGQREYRTKACHHGGTKPVFNETFSFEVLGENEAVIVLKDHEMIMPDEFLGRGTLPLTGFRERPNEPLPAAVPLYSKHGTQHGQVHLVVTFTPQYGGAGAYPPPAVQYPTPSVGGYPGGAPSYAAPSYGAPQAYGAPTAAMAGGNTVVVEEATAPPMMYAAAAPMGNTVVVDERRGLFGRRDDVTVVEQPGFGYGAPMGGTDVIVDERRGLFGRRDNVEVVEPRPFGGPDVIVDERRGLFGRRDNVEVVEPRPFGGPDVVVDERRGLFGRRDDVVVDELGFGGRDVFVEERRRG